MTAIQQLYNYYKDPNSINESEISFKEYLCRFILIRIKKIECDFSHSHNLLDMFKFQAKISYLLKFEHILVCWKTYFSVLVTFFLEYYFEAPKAKILNFKFWHVSKLKIPFVRTCFISWRYWRVICKDAILSFFFCPFLLFPLSFFHVTKIINYTIEVEAPNHNNETNSRFQKCVCFV